MRVRSEGTGPDTQQPKGLIGGETRRGHLLRIFLTNTQSFDLYCMYYISGVLMLNTILFT